ncbi:lytic transglycosylase domain-containing protein [Erythrobacter sp. SCSIO 43205]|uniref:lytic transglycosylase domain-containing protein n=1 Tax=Erythrobacter sp. SCSIO 43205 TaxID=2779361 RepID=UPI001CA8F8E5|nr:lytic transglycosylase domain-containing protein [Erythrobacter sp. SCSIO 43205]UAB77980.1 lytic transglycosylase domain-containing protein [Erythrobacter sp. SCSIO 43205]
MILAGGRRHIRVAVTALAASAWLATPAYADVLEVTPQGSQWVAGGPAQIHQPVMTSGPLEDVSGLVISEDIVAIPQVHAAGIPAQYAAKINDLSQRYGLSPALLEALVWQESRWRERAVSPAGARGLAQLMPGTARYLGVNPDDPMQNLEGGARYLREQLDRFDGDLEKALAAYNAGPGRVQRAGGIPNIRETRNYVTSILGRLANHSRPKAQHLAAGHR